MGAAAGRDHQRADAGTELQRVPSGQAENIADEACKGECSLAVNPGEAGAPAAAAPGKDTSEDSQSAHGTADVLNGLAYNVNYWVLWGLRLVVKVVVVLGPVAVIALIDYYKEPRD